MLDANECRERARQFIQMSVEATDLITKQRLVETAEGWLRLAADLAKIEERGGARSDIGKQLKKRKRANLPN
jgi:hypothetical protein